MWYITTFYPLQIDSLYKTETDFEIILIITIVSMLVLPSVKWDSTLILTYIQAHTF